MPLSVKQSSLTPSKTLSRLVSFGGACVCVEYTAGRAAEIVDYLCSCLGSDREVSPHVTLSLHESAADGIFTLCRDGEVCCRDHSPGAIGSWLLHLTTLELASRSTGGLLLHAAAVAWDGRCVVLPGATGAGKTMLAAFLAGRGFQYMTDELTFIAEASATVEGFVRPLKIKIVKTDGDSKRRGQVPVPVQDSEMLIGACDVLVAADARAIAPPRDRASLGHIVFPRYRRRSRLDLEPLSAGQTALRLMACALNGHCLPDHGFDAAARLANTVRGYELRYSSLREIEAHLDIFRGPCSTALASSHAGVSAST